MSKNFQVYFIHINFFKKPNKKFTIESKSYTVMLLYFFFNSLLSTCPKKNGKWKMAQRCRLSPILLPTLPYIAFFYYVFWQDTHVSEVLNVHANESKNKPTLFRKIFFSKQGKINFWERRCDFVKYFFKFQFILFHCGYLFVNFVHRTFRTSGTSYTQCLDSQFLSPWIRIKSFFLNYLSYITSYLYIHNIQILYILAHYVITSKFQSIFKNIK